MLRRTVSFIGDDGLDFDEVICGSLSVMPSELNSYRFEAALTTPVCHMVLYRVSKVLTLVHS